jgi:hypothetical protein
VFRTLLIIRVADIHAIRDDRRARATGPRTRDPLLPPRPRRALIEVAQATGVPQQPPS